MIEPTGDRHRIPFVGPPNRLLRGKPPTLKMAPDRPSRKPDTEPPDNQPLNGFRRPQYKRQLQLLRVMVTVLVPVLVTVCVTCTVQVAVHVCVTVPLAVPVARMTFFPALT